MLVAIDVGNTQTVIGLYAPGDGPGGSSSELLHHWRIATVASRTADEMALLIDQLFQLQGLDPAEAITGIAVASVVPRLRTALREMSDRWFKVETVIVEPGVRTGMPIHYDNPKEVGADRIADAVAAFERYGGPTIVVDFGTATTFEVVSEQGRVPRRHHRPGHRDLARGPLRPGRPVAPRSSWSSPGACWPRTRSSRCRPGSSTASRPRWTGCAGGSQEEVGPVHGGGDRRPGRADRAVFGGHRTPRAVADPRRAAHHLRPQRAVSRTGHEPPVPYRFERDAPAAALASGSRARRRRTRSGRGGDRGRPADAAPGDGEAGLRHPARLDRRHPAVRRGRPGPTTSPEFGRLSLGDWIGATGEVVRTRTGELSVKVASWVLLAEARRSFGDKWRGITDVDLRYRQRYADLWANEGVPGDAAPAQPGGVVDPPVAGGPGLRRGGDAGVPPIPGGAAARPFVTHHNALDIDLYLRIAPELYLKRLVVGGFEQVFEIARVFRNEGLSTRHNPEFTMLELYQAYADYTDMMA